jgi:hypothetical protein
MEAERKIGTAREIWIMDVAVLLGLAVVFALLGLMAGYSAGVQLSPPPL